MLYLVIFSIFMLIILALTVALFIFKFKVLVEYLRNDDDDHIVLSLFALGGLIKYKYEIPLIDVESTGVKFKKIKEKGKHEKDIKKDKGKIGFLKMYDNMKAIMDFIRHHNDIICEIRRYLKGKFILYEFELDVEMGTGDAYYTGILGGLLWAAAGVLVSLLANTFTSLKKRVNIKSQFNKRVFHVDLYCIFSVRIVHIIVVILKILLHRLRIWLQEISKHVIGGGISG